MRATISRSDNPLSLAQRVQVEHVTRSAVTLRDAARADDRPVIVARNGDWVLRENWDEQIRDGDVISVVHLPLGPGGGSNPMRTLLLIAVAAFAPYVAGAMGFQAGTLAFKIAAAGIGLLGTTLVNALIPPPKPPSYDSAAGLASPSPTYSLQAQGNSARIGMPIPVQYGRLSCYPDFAAQPYLEYVGGDQYLYQLLCVGAGQYDIEGIYIDDTPISTYEDVEHEVIAPGGTSKLYPHAVYTSSEVSGIDLTKDDSKGPYYATSAGIDTTRISIDLVCPRGLYNIANDGTLTTRSVTCKIYIIGSDGGSVSHIVTLEGATTTPLRETHGYDVPRGRYRVRVVRTSDEAQSTRAADTLVWTGLRAHAPDSTTYGDVTLIAVRMRASAQLNSKTTRMTRVVCTRKLPIYNKTTKTWSAPQKTRSIAWAIADVARAQYGARLDDQQIDLGQLAKLDTLYTSRGDNFDGRFDNSLTIWEALSRIAAVGRARPYIQGGVLSVARDGAESLPVAMYTERNILRSSLSVNYLMPSGGNGGVVDVEYHSNSTWRPDVVRCAINHGSGEPTKIQLFGCTERAQAHREGLYHAAANRYRRRIITFATEMEGFIPSLGDLIAITHDMPAWGQAYGVLSYDASSRTLTLDGDPQWRDGKTHYVGLRRRDGSVDGPIRVSKSTRSNQLVLSSAADFTPVTGGSMERTVISFGWGTTWRQLARVTAIRPKTDITVEIEAVNEDPSVHTADTGQTLPPEITSQLDTIYADLPIRGLIARSKPDDPTVILVSWQPTPGAEHYIIDMSADGQKWTRTAETRATSFPVDALYLNQTILRVSAANAISHGPWATLYYAHYSDYMWHPDPGTLMWDADDSKRMWIS